MGMQHRRVTWMRWHDRAGLTRAGRVKTAGRDTCAEAFLPDDPTSLQRHAPRPTSASASALADISRKARAMCAPIQRMAGTETTFEDGDSPRTPTEACAPRHGRSYSSIAASTPSCVLEGWPRCDGWAALMCADSCPFCVSGSGPGCQGTGNPGPLGAANPRGPPGGATLAIAHCGETGACERGPRGR